MTTVLRSNMDIALDDKSEKITDWKQEMGMKSEVVVTVSVFFDSSRVYYYGEKLRFYNKIKKQ
jgi:hypothetical protein